MTLRCVVADDETLVRRHLRGLLEDAGVQVVAECATGDEAARAVVELEPDAAFLDIHMPGMDGFGVMEQVGVSRLAAVVFVTAYDQHALRALQLGAADYLLKPVVPDELARAVARVRQRVAARPRPAGPAYLERLLVRHDGRVLVVPVSRVEWFEAADDSVRVHASSEVYTIRGPLGELADRLDPALFARIHRSTIVRLDRVREIQPWFKGESVAVLENGPTLRVGGSYRDEFLRRLAGGGRVDG
ncbi:MAG TPA: LytTR family DNA-binding domain-containing protein [Longimicrobium sp.]|jgi:two-component system LytT family response regulator